MFQLTRNCRSWIRFQHKTAQITINVTFVITSHFQLIFFATSIEKVMFQVKRNGVKKIAYITINVFFVIQPHFQQKFYDSTLLEKFVSIYEELLLFEIFLKLSCMHKNQCNVCYLTIFPIRILQLHAQRKVCLSCLGTVKV